MAKKRYINPAFPFRNSNEGNFVRMTQTDSEAIKADIVHIVLTQKGERLYLPEFGTNLRKFIFEPQDAPTYNDMRREIREAITTFIPNLTVDEIEIDDSEDQPHFARIRIDYTITDDVFESKDFVEINF